MTVCGAALRCRCRCGGSLNHTLEGELHFAPPSKSQPGTQQLCQYQERLNNRIWTCRRCYETRGVTTQLTKKMASSAYSNYTTLALASYFWQGYADTRAELVWPPEPYALSPSRIESYISDTRSRGSRNT